MIEIVFKYREDKTVSPWRVKFAIFRKMSDEWGNKLIGNGVVTKEEWLNFVMAMSQPGVYFEEEKQHTRQ